MLNDVFRVRFRSRILWDFAYLCWNEPDIANILRQGVLDFGHQKAEEYYEGLVDRLSNISERPLMYQAVDEIKSGYRRSVYNVHSIYFQIRQTEVLIIRILGRKDPISAIKKAN